MQNEFRNKAKVINQCWQITSRTKKEYQKLHGENTSLKQTLERYQNYQKQQQQQQKKGGR